MKKPVVMLLLSAALVGGYFFISRKASASTVDGQGGGLFDLLGLAPTSGGAAGAQGTVPFSEVVQGTTLFPGGGTTPLAFEGTAPRPGTTTVKGGGGPTIIPTAPTRFPGGGTTPLAFEGGAGSGVPRLIDRLLNGGGKTPTLAPGKSPPVPKPKKPAKAPAPIRPAPKPVPIAVRRAVGVSGRTAGKDSRLLALR